MSPRTTSTLRVRYGETDQMGVAYHANYLAWCEVGRTDYMREQGATYADLERAGHFLAVAEASVRYGKPARYDDVIEVETWVEAVKSRAITFAYELSRVEPDPARLATARTVLVSLDRNGVPTRLPDAVRSMFAAG